MPLDGLIVDRRHQVVAIDFFLVYAIRATCHAQLYARGVIKRIGWFVPYAPAIEYRPGVVHIPQATYERYQQKVAECLETPGYCALRVATTARLGVTIARLARANWRWERHRDAESLAVLIRAAQEAMAFYNLNDETGLPDLLIRAAGSDRLASMIRQAITPVVTPYMLLLADRAESAYHRRDDRSLRRYASGAWFLQEFDTLDTGEPDNRRLLTDAARYSIGRCDHREDKRSRRQRRTLARAAVAKYLSDWAEHDRIRLLELIDLAAAAADHEEARHYWQGRTLRNLRLIAAARNLDLREVTLDDIAR